MLKISFLTLSHVLSFVMLPDLIFVEPLVHSNLWTILNLEALPELVQMLRATVC